MRHAYACWASRPSGWALETALTLASSPYAPAASSRLARRGAAACGEVMHLMPPPRGGREAYSYRADPAVPAFDDAGVIVFMDGACALCSGAARAIARADNANIVRIATVQSTLGRAVLTHYGLDADDPDTWLYLEEGRAYASLDGVIRLAARLGGWMRAFTVLRILPRAARDWLYRRIARNRYRIFGHGDLCAMPDAAVRARLIA